MTGMPLSVKPSTANSLFGNSQLLLLLHYSLCLVLFNQYLLGTYYAPDIELDARDSIDWVSALIKYFFGGRQTTNKHYIQLLQSMTSIRK